MVPNTKDTGRIIELMAKVASGMLMVICLKETSSMTSQMEWELTPALMGLSTLACGLMTFSTGKGRRVGLMALLSSVITKRGRKMEWVVTHGLKEISIRANGRTI